ncbi:unnamed protein product [Mytilus coruscus]|uniref:Mutator-like transposase domain-containing protein n=1 Tax=Mytilus coruscus TaxID=42192 RepID=A0A6J8A2M2_MYTCO|nr:unnamed protein product [Mytilus coruscus]
MKSARKNQRSEDSSNRTVNVRLNAIKWNSVFGEHQRLHPNCNGFLQWNMEREEKFGFVNREEAMCDKCTYRSKKFKLYEEVQTKNPGRKAAKINVSAQAALSQTPLGYTGLRKIVLGCNMPAPSTSGLQKRAYKVLLEIVNINKKDMKARRKQLIAINTLRERKDPGSVNIGDEYTWAKEALQDLVSDGIEAKHLTTDPDSSAYRAADDLYLENTTSTEPEHFLDTRHFLNNHRKNIKNNKELGEIMPGRTKKDREKLLNNFALDLAERCQSEFTQAMEKYGGDFLKVKNKISFTVDAIPACYTANHELCHSHSFVCKGGKKF